MKPVRTYLVRAFDAVMVVYGVLLVFGLVRVALLTFESWPLRVIAIAVAVGLSVALVQIVRRRLRSVAG